MPEQSSTLRVGVDSTDMERGSRRGEDALDRLGRKATATETQFDRLQNRLGGFRALFAALGVGVAVREFTRLLDATTNIDNRLRLVTNTTDELNAVYGELLAISNRTRTSLSDNAEIFNRLAMATSSLGLTYQDQLDLTERLNQALIISGATAQEGAAALRQLGQALSAGKLSGDEFVSVNENLPRVMEAVADSLGVPRGALRQLAADGKLTAQVIVDAMANASDELASEFAQITPTISGAFTVLNNNIQNFVRDINNAGAIGEIFARSILFVADHLDIFIGGLAALAVLVTGMVIPSLVAMTAAFLATPIGWVVAGIAAITLGLAAFGDTTVEIGGRTVTVWQTIKAALMTVASIFGQIYDAAVVVFTGISQTMGQWAETARQAFLSVWEWSKEAWEGAKATASGFFSSIVTRLDEFLSNWGLSLDQIGEWIRSAINTYIGLYVGFVSAIGPVVTEGIPALFRLAMAVAKNVVIDALEGIINTFVRGLGGIGDALDYIPGIEGAGQGIRDALTVDFSDLRSDTEAYKNEVTAAGQAITTAFGGALERDYIGEIGTSVREGAETIRTEFNETILDPFNSAIESTGAALRDEFNTNLDAVVENQETSAAMQEILNRQFNDGVAPVTNFGNAAGGAAGQLAELNKQRQEFIDGITEEYATIRGESGHAQEQVTIWYNEQKAQLESLGLAHTQYADMLEYILGSRMREARQQDLANATDWVSGIQRALMSIEDDVGTAADMAEEAFTSAFNKSADALAEFVMTGKLDFAELARSIISDIIKMMTKMLLMKALQATLGFFGFADGGLVPGFANGGQVHGPGTGTSDSIFAKLSNGEFVVNADATRQFLPLLQQINSKKMPKYADGGVVGSLAEAMPQSAPRREEQDRSQGPNITFNISTPDADSFRQSEAQIATRMRRIAQRGARGA